MFANAALNDFNLLEGSPCIDAGNPSSPLDPDGTYADMGALFFDQGPGGLSAPAAPSNFTVAHNNSQLIATLSWTNPSTTPFGAPLTELTGVKVYREDDLIADLTDVVIGQSYEYEDTAVPSIGMWEYTLLPYNSFANGLYTSASAWIGLDAPGEPGNVVATPDPNQALECTITWDSPTVGAHGGYWPAGSWTGQKVYRNGNLIADLTGSNNTYLDNNIPIAEWYSYGVSYYNSTGEGPITPAEPDPVFVGPPQFLEVAYDWVEISTIGTNTGITGDDQVLGPFNIGFAFPFYEYSAPTQVWICSNGWASFSQVTYGAYLNYPIPTSSAPNNLVCPFWDDLNPSQGGDIYYYYDEANNRFIVEWKDVPHYSTGGNYTFEMILYPNGDIDLMYNDLSPGTPNSATVGIENATGTNGIQVTYNGSGPLEPEAEMGIRIFSVALGAANVAVTLTPYGAPIQIPAPGGSFDYNIAVENLEGSPVTGDVWCDVLLPNGSVYGPVLGPVSVVMPTGFSGNRDRTQSVPGAAPSGTYTYNGYVGSFPGAIWAQDSFTFEKLTTGDGPWVGEWTNTGESFDDWMGTPAKTVIPDVFSLDQNYPNPFNPTTTIGFALPEAVRVNLKIYDITGRLVTTLVNGWREAGYHEASFDANGLASGMYIYRIKAGDYTDCGKMMLMK